jgi:hypothetical protein
MYRSESSSSLSKQVYSSFYHLLQQQLTLSLSLSLSLSRSTFSNNKIVLSQNEIPPSSLQLTAIGPFSWSNNWGPTLKIQFTTIVVNCTSKAPEKTKESDAAISTIHQNSSIQFQTNHRSPSTKIAHKPEHHAIFLEQFFPSTMRPCSDSHRQCEEELEKPKRSRSLYRYMTFRPFPAKRAGALRM